MNSDKLVFAQLMEHLPLHICRCVQRYPSKYPTKTFSHLDQFLCMAQRFYGTTENAIKTQIWIAISFYVLVAIVKKRLNTEASLYTILQILSLTLFEKIPIDQLVKNTEVLMDTPESYNKLNLFN